MEDSFIGYVFYALGFVVGIVLIFAFLQFLMPVGLLIAFALVLGGFFFG